MDPQTEYRGLALRVERIPSIKKNDCVIRAISIAGQIRYAAAENLIQPYVATERPGAKRRRGRRSRDDGRGVYGATVRRCLAAHGWSWTPTLRIGQRHRVRLRDGDVPMTGRLILSLCRHVVPIVDGVLWDTHDPTRNGNRTVHGYYTPPPVTATTTAPGWAEWAGRP